MRENGDGDEGGLTTTRDTEMERRAIRDRSKKLRSEMRQLLNLATIKRPEEARI